MRASKYRFGRRGPRFPRPRFSIAARDRSAGVASLGAAFYAARGGRIFSGRNPVGDKSYLIQAFAFESRSIGVSCWPEVN